MKKQELTPTLQEWVDYLNKHYRWHNDKHNEITPKRIEIVLRMSRYIVDKEQDQ
jgi:hypothetical protein